MDFLGLCFWLFEFLVLGLLPLVATIIAFAYIIAIMKAIKAGMKKSMETGMKDLVK